MDGADIKVFCTMLSLENPGLAIEPVSLLRFRGLPHFLQNRALIDACVLQQGQDLVSRFMFLSLSICHCRA